MKTITEQKPLEEIQNFVENDRNIYIIGCGTCATLCRTGGKSEVLKMKEYLESIGKNVVGWMIIPSVCDDLTNEALKDDAERVRQADAILVMACAFGVHTVSAFSSEYEVMVYPGLNTLFIGKPEGQFGLFTEVCSQCGDCLLGSTGGICPITICPKGLLNGPCGGTNRGKCEEDPERDCAWTLIYKRLSKLGRLNEMRKYREPRNYMRSSKPRKIFIASEEGVENG